MKKSRGSKRTTQNKKPKIYNFKDSRPLKRGLKTRRKARKTTTKLQTQTIQRTLQRLRPGHGRRSPKTCSTPSKRHC